MWIQLQKHFAARSLEWFNALFLTGWGSYVILNPQLFSTVSTLSGLTTLGPQERWGLLAFTCGFIRLVALFINGHWGLTPWIRLITSVISIFAWFWISVGLFRSSPSPDVIIYPGLLLADMFSAFRAASDANQARTNKILGRQIEEGLTNVRSIVPR
jgi:hypothetical protein